MTRGFRGVALLVTGFGAALPLLASAQTAVRAQPRPGEQACDGRVTGFLGITRLDCRGLCTLALDHQGESGTWSFSAEPRIVELAPNSPAASMLKIGDEIVAIDDTPITSTEGGSRLANIERDRVVTVRYRRDGAIREAALHAGARCGPGVEGLRAIPPVYSRVDSVAEPGAAAGAGILIQIDDSVDGRRTTISVQTPGVSGRSAVPAMPETLMGMDFTCGPCSTILRDGRRLWRFSNPIQVVGLELGGPADRAGIRVEERITHVNGISIDSPAGGDAFSNLRPGQTVRLTLVGLDGINRTVSIVLADRK